MQLASWQSAERWSGSRFPSIDSQIQCVRARACVCVCEWTVLVSACLKFRVRVATGVLKNVWCLESLTLRSPRTKPFGTNDSKTGQRSGSQVFRRTDRYWTCIDSPTTTTPGEMPVTSDKGQGRPAIFVWFHDRPLQGTTEAPDRFLGPVWNQASVPA